MRRLELGIRRLFPAVARRIYQVSPRAELDPAHVHRILIIRQHNQLGDMLCVVPLLRALRAQFPRAAVDLLASPGNAQMMRHHRLLAEVLIFNKKEYLRRLGVRPIRIMRMARELRARKYDLVAVPATISVSLTSDILAALTGAAHRFGPRSINGVSNPGAFLYTHPVDLDWRQSPSRHQTLRNADLLSAVVPAPEDLSHEITLTAAETGEGRQTAQRLRNGKDLLVFLHPGAGKPANRWPVESFAHLARSLQQEFDVSVVASIGPMDHEVYRILYSLLGDAIQYDVNTPIRAFASTLSYADLLITNDTGIMHVAASVQSAVLSLFGPTNPREWAPIAHTSRYIHGSPIGEIPVTSVLAMAGEILRESASTGGRSGEPRGASNREKR
jgi:ADP-heptose:LPS heptosyltransferase